MPISLTPYRPTPFTLDGSAPPECSLMRPETAMSWADACQRLSDAFLALGHPLPDPVSEGVGEATYQVPSRFLRVRVGLGAVGDEGAEAVARRILTAVFGSEGDWKASSDAAFAVPGTAWSPAATNRIPTGGFWPWTSYDPASATSVASAMGWYLNAEGPTQPPGDRGADDGEDPHGY